MGITGVWQWIVVGLIVVLLFARPGKISRLMGDIGVGFKNFKEGVKDKNNSEALDVDESKKDTKNDSI